MANDIGISFAVSNPRQRLTRRTINSGIDERMRIAPLLHRPNDSGAPSAKMPRGLK
jgi:hypothetical protein